MKYYFIAFTTPASLPPLDVTRSDTYNINKLPNGSKILCYEEEGSHYKILKYRKLLMGQDSEDLKLPKEIEEFAKGRAFVERNSKTYNVEDGKGNCFYDGVKGNGIIEGGNKSETATAIFEDVYFYMVRIPAEEIRLDILYRDSILQMFRAYYNYLKVNGGLGNAKGYEELYKWGIIEKCKGKPNLNASDFVSEMITWAKEMNNLLYVGMQPTALRHLAEHHPSELKQAISTLFNEAMPLNNRVETYINICDNCWDDNMRKMYGDTTKSCADERLASDFLTCHAPQKYTFYKNSVYEGFCKYLGIDKKKAGEKLSHFYELINDICLPIYREQRELRVLIDKEVVDADYEINDLLAIQTALYLLSENQLNINNDNNISTNMITSKYEKYIKQLKANRNIVLTGAPGTGKTYLAKEIAKEMGAEVGFVQFHPSYDYTDFVEGLRPTKSDRNGNIGFERKDGVFKEFCKKAIKMSASATKVVHGNINECKPLSANVGDSFYSLYEELKRRIKTDNVILYTVYPRTIMEVRVEGDDILYKKGDRYDSNYISEVYVKRIYDYYKGRNIYDITRASFGDFCDIIGNTLNYTYYRGIVQELLNMSKNAKSSLSPVLKVETKTDELKPKTYNYDEEKEDISFVFIIDEINRGEMSKIFGELFFSIDPGYRGEAGRVKTQYQNLITDKNDSFHEGFFVPDNVYIIGTMNDIDRSVESMDFAMRRRFTWMEVTADESIENMGISGEKKETMIRLNNAIKDMEGLGKDYQLGGAYFLDDMSKEERWQYRIEGLLREYLRGMNNVEEKMETLKKAYDGGKDNNEVDAD